LPHIFHFVANYWWPAHDNRCNSKR
jgi:hypothetical protein